MATEQLNHPPMSLDDYLPSLQRQGVPEEILRSPNDGEEFVTVWNVELRKLKAKGSEKPVVAFEKRGIGGKRHVLRGRADVVLLTEEELKGSVLPEGYIFPF